MIAHVGYASVRRSPIYWLQLSRNLAELLKRGLKAFDDLGGDFVGWRQEVWIVEAVVLEPEDI